jgi:hypothetical protein
MARLYVLSGPDLGKSFEVAPGATLGRSTDCAVALRDHSVSRQHARLDCHDGRWSVVDLDSRNGLFVGAAKTPRAALADGDEFKLGEVLLRFRAVAVEEPPPPPPPPPPPVEEEIVLEGAHEEPKPQPAFPKPASPSPELVRTARMASPARGALEQRERGILQYSKVESRGGFIQADLAQQPWYVKLGVWLLALAIFALVGWAAFHATSFFKEKISGPPAEQDR